jgi:hypothetical protein
LFEYHHHHYYVYMYIVQWSRPCLASMKHAHFHLTVTSLSYLNITIISQLNWTKSFEIMKWHVTKWNCTPGTMYPTVISYCLGIPANSCWAELEELAANWRSPVNFVERYLYKNPQMGRTDRLRPQLCVTWSITSRITWCMTWRISRTRSPITLRMTWRMARSHVTHHAIGHVSLLASRHLVWACFILVFKTFIGTIPLLFFHAL